MTTINEGKKTVTLRGMTWSLRECGLTDIVAEYGADIVGAVLSDGGYYPPMIDASENVKIEEECQAKMVARAYASFPSVPSTATVGHSSPYTPDRPHPWAEKRMLEPCNPSILRTLSHTFNTFR
jgi:hypothetical protein